MTVVTSSSGATQAETAVRPSQSLLSITWRQLRRNPGAMLGLIIILLLIMVALFAPQIAPYDPLRQNFRSALQPPSVEHPFGTDDVGRDILSRVIFGTQISLRVGLVAVSISASLGVLLGLVAGYYGGWADTLISGVTDTLLAFPGLLLALAVVAVPRPPPFNLLIAGGVGNLPASLPGS
ncbi:MAG TPA: ABC transporter permease, partial [Roseiflexaceae bacterium]|nr:ABC transporter permease [Roseiflexaceae bacterium]